jgi:hypothetical protein
MPCLLINITLYYVEIIKWAYIKVLYIEIIKRLNNLYGIKINKRTL